MSVSGIGVGTTCKGNGTIREQTTGGEGTELKREVKNTNNGGEGTINDSL